ncbi:MAG: hypothetical protein HFJ38_07170 [Bacilli bacterium]|nr:hypothetical protein [Bacilli bacterium]
MYRTNYNMPTTMYRGSKPVSNHTINPSVGGYYDERGFFIPFVVGGLAGGALGYGIANNNFLAHQSQPNQGFYPPIRPCCPGPYPVMPYPYY